MRRPDLWSWMAVTLLGLTITNAFAQADRVPASLALAIDAREAAEGARVPVTVALRNYRNEPVETPRPLTVTLASELMDGPARIVIRAGGRSGQTALVFNRPGVAKITASAPDLPAAYGVIAITPRDPGRSLLGSVSPLLANAVNGLFPRLTAAAQPGRGARLWIEVLPPRISPRDGTWTGVVMVGLADAGGTPIVATRDVPVRLAAEVGTVAPDYFVIPRGAATGGGDVRVVSDQPGADVIHAISTTLGDRAQREVDYERPRPSRLFVTSTPAEVVSNGRTNVQIAVVLKDDDNHVVPNPGDEAVRVLLGSTFGSLSHQVVAIPPGRPDSDTVALLSRRAGRAIISAQADGLDGDEVVVRFAVPWLLIALACGGGTVGAMLRSRRRHRRGTALQDLGIGGLLGVVFFALTLFGFPGMLPVIPLQTLDSLTLNEIGAFVLGVLGGHIGRDFLTRLAASARLPERRPAAVS